MGQANAKRKTATIAPSSACVLAYILKPVNRARERAMTER